MPDTNHTLAGPNEVSCRLRRGCVPDSSKSWGRKLGTESNWRSRVSRLLGVVDAFVITWAVTGAYVIRFGLDPDGFALTQDTNYAWFSVALGIAWWLMLGAWSSRQSRILGAGPDEYKRVAAASLWLFGLIAIFSYVFRIETARGYVGIALPVGLAGILSARWVLRQHLSVARRRGQCMSRLLILGGPSAVAHLSSSLHRVRHAGYLPVAAYTPGVPDLTSVSQESGLPVLGHDSDTVSILQAVTGCDADTVAISAGVQLHPQVIRHLGWELANRNIGLIMAPALTDIAGPRIHTQQVAGLPLIHVTTPSLEAGQRIAKRLFDVLVSTTLIAILSPLLAFLALLVRLDSRGPSLFRQERVGVRGNSFEMLKFRSMVHNAEVQLPDLVERSEGNGVLFKMRNDPRVTRLGRILRRYSLDELPQLFNVLGGTMSLVGPRPPLPSEVAKYEQDVRRRLLVKPGVTGLWQVSGRSNLSWQDSVRLDLYYVENWSLIGDLVILLRTVRAVFGSSGAY